MARASAKTQAREKARAARAKADAERQERERQITEAQEAFFIAESEHQDALAEAAKHEQVMAEQVARMLDLGENIARVAQLCDRSESDIRRLKREAVTSNLDSVAPAPTTPPAGQPGQAERAASTTQVQAGAADEVPAEAAAS